MDKAMPDALKDKMNEMKNKGKDKDKELDKSEESDDDEPKTDKMDKALDATVSMFEELLSKSAQGRRDQLLAKAQRDTLDDAEREELIKSLSGASGESKIADELTKAMHPEGDAGEDLQKAMDIDVNGYLAGIHTGLTDALEVLGNRLEKGFNERSEREYVLAKGLRDLCVVVQSQRQEMDSLAKSLGDFGRAPARPQFRSQSVEPLNKGFAGNAPTGQEITRGEVRDWFAKSIEAGTAEMIGGEDILMAATKFETSGAYSPAVAQAVLAARQGQ